MAVAQYTPPTPTNLTSPAQMSPADVDVPRTSPAEIVRATDNYSHLHGWDTHTHTQLNRLLRTWAPNTQCIHKSRQSIPSKMPRSYTNTCSPSWWWSVFELVTGSAGRHM